MFLSPNLLLKTASHSDDSLFPKFSWWLSQVSVTEQLPHKPEMNLVVMEHAFSMALATTCIEVVLLLLILN